MTNIVWMNLKQEEVPPHPPNLIHQTSSTKPHPPNLIRNPELESASPLFWGITVLSSFSAYSKIYEPGVDFPEANT